MTHESVHGGHSHCEGIYAHRGQGFSKNTVKEGTPETHKSEPQIVTYEPIRQIRSSDGLTLSGSEDESNGEGHLDDYSDVRHEIPRGPGWDPQLEHRETDKTSEHEYLKNKRMTTWLRCYKAYTTAILVARPSVVHFIDSSDDVESDNRGSHGPGRPVNPF